MKAAKIVLITVLCGLILFLCSVLGMGMREGSSFFSRNGGSIFSNYELVQEWEMSPDAVTQLSVHYGMNNNDVLLYEGTGDKIVIREYANFEMEEGQRTTVRQEENELTVQGRNRSFMFFYIGAGRHAYTEIYLPAGFDPDIYIKTLSGDIVSTKDISEGNVFEVSSTSGDIRFQSVEAESITASSTSGEIFFEKAAAATISVSTTSGDIGVQKAEGNVTVSSTSGNILLNEAQGSVSASTTSGDIGVQGGVGEWHASSSSGEIRLSGVNGKFDLNTTSGDIFLGDGAGCGKAHSISGEISIELARLDGNLSVGTTSGDVRLWLPAEAGFGFDFDSVSGECRTFFDEVLSFNKKGTSASGVYGGNTNTEVVISTTSGDVWISEN